MRWGFLVKRLFRVGDETGIAVFADTRRAFDSVGLWGGVDAGPGEPPGAARVFLLAGRTAERARIGFPRESETLMETRHVVLKSFRSCIYGEWYGKARSVMDPGKRSAVILVPGLKFYNRDFMARLVLRPILDRLLFECGYVPLHAAGTASGGKALIIAGETGTGKSTLLKGLMDSGMCFLADDRLLLRTDSGTPTVHLFPEYLRLPATEKGPKWAVVPPAPSVRTAAAGVILFLERGNPAGRDLCEPIGSAEAAARMFRFISPSIPGNSYERVFHVIGDLCGEARGFIVRGWGAPRDRLRRVREILGETT